MKRFAPPPLLVLLLVATGVRSLTAQGARDPALTQAIRTTVEAPEFGRRFSLEVERRWPSRITVPEFTVGQLAPLTVRATQSERREEPGFVVERLRFECQAFVVGPLEIRLAPLEGRGPRGVVREAGSGASVTLQVRSSLAESDSGVPERPREPFGPASGAARWLSLLFTAVAIAGVGVIAWLRTRRPAEVTRREALVSPEAAALSELRALRETSEGAVPVGQRLVEICRAYLATDLEEGAASRTSRALVEAATCSGRVDHEAGLQWRDLLDAADRLRFDVRAEASAAPELVERARELVAAAEASPIDDAEEPGT